MTALATRVHVFFRTFLLQAAWNYDRMQHLGFAYAIRPALARIWPDREAASVAVQRHLEYFNTHPYLAGALVGAAVKLEEEVKAGARPAGEVGSFKNGIMGSYGAIGDAFFYAGLRPLGAVLSAVLILLGAGPLGPIAFLLGFDAVALTVRTYGFFAGCAVGPEVVARLSRIGFAEGTRAVKLASALLSGMAVALWARHAEGIPSRWSEGLAFPLVVALAGTARRGLPPAGMALLLAAVAAGLKLGWRG